MSLLAKVIAEAKKRLETANADELRSSTKLEPAKPGVPTDNNNNNLKQIASEASGLNYRTPSLSTQNQNTTKSEPLIYNSKQQEFINSVLSNNHTILIGAAGTGKTTSTRGALTALIQQKYLPRITFAHKSLDSTAPGIVAVAYTRRAVQNLKKAMPPELLGNCCTIHALLEFMPVYYETFDDEGKPKKTLRFEPTRHSANPLPDTIKYIILDETSMVSVALFALLRKAIKHPVTFIYLGDIAQLPPVMGSAILGYKLLAKDHNKIELTEVYRQALDSPIISLAHKIRLGLALPRELESLNSTGLTITTFSKKISFNLATLVLTKFLCKEYDSGTFAPGRDIALIPFNKNCGTIEINKGFATHLAQKLNQPVYEILGGYEPKYFRLGEAILYNKEDATIIKIEHNPDYILKPPQKPSKNLDYWGHLQNQETPTTELQTENIDKFLKSLELEDNLTRKSSHIITIKMKLTEEEIVLDKAADISSLELGYCLTIHKSQGSEWHRVYLLLHHSHATMLSNELLYTGITRAREHLHIVCEKDSLQKGQTARRIAGSALEEKAEFFKGKLDRNEENLLSLI